LTVFCLLGLLFYTAIVIIIIIIIIMYLQCAYYNMNGGAFLKSVQQRKPADIKVMRFALSSEICGV